MNIFVYSDESGVFDKKHNNFFVFGGLIILGKESKEEWTRRYIAAEKAIKDKYEDGVELKAALISNKDKHKIIRSLNNCYKFGVIIDQQKILGRIFQSKKDKQRYLDYAYKIALKRALEHMIQDNLISKDSVENIYVSVDEHTTATNGRYELREGLEQEFKNGTYNYNYGFFYEPLFSSLNRVELSFCNSAVKPLIRAADLVANNIYYAARHNISPDKEKLYITRLP